MISKELGPIRSFKLVCRFKFPKGAQSDLIFQITTMMSQNMQMN